MAKPYNFFTVPDNSVYYRDLRQLRDDKTVLENPHKGWYIHYIDNGIRRGEYREDITSPDVIRSLPGTKLLYLRLDWVDIERSDGVFDFSAVDRIFETYEPLGFKFIFRFCTYEGFGPCANATPDFVFRAGAKYTTVGDDREPDYGDPVFLHYVDRFIAACAEKYNGHPSVESVDVGTLGTWGEGHTWLGSMCIIPAECHKKHIDIHLKHFTRTRVTLNYCAITFTQKHDPEGAKRLVDYCAGLGMGLRCDSLNVESYIHNFGYNTLCSPDLYELFGVNAPVDLEFEHYSATGRPELFRDGFPHLDALRQVKATFAGFHGNVTTWMAEHPYLHEYLANRLGYWYFIDGFCLPPIPSGAHGLLKLKIFNQGFSRAYYDYNVRVILKSGDEEFEVCNTSAHNTDWQPDELSTACYKLDVTDVLPGEYELCFGMFEGDRPILFGMKNEFYKDGFYTLGKVTVE